MSIPRWKELVRAWRAHGRHGLTVPFLCAATGAQPWDLVQSLYLHQSPIFRCGVVLAPIVGQHISVMHPRGGMAESTTHFLQRWFLLSNTHPVGYDDLAMYAYGLLAEGRVSVPAYGGYDPYGSVECDVSRYGPFTPYERAFIYQVLGKLPPEITGVSAYGRIVYDYSG